MGETCSPCTPIYPNRCWAPQPEHASFLRVKHRLDEPVDDMFVFGGGILLGNFDVHSPPHAPKQEGALASNTMKPIRSPPVPQYESITSLRTARKQAPANNSSMDLSKPELRATRRHLLSGASSAPCWFPPTSHLPTLFSGSSYVSCILVIHVIVCDSGSLHQKRRCRCETCILHLNDALRLEILLQTTHPMMTCI